MTKKALCLLFRCRADKHGFQMAMHQLGKRLRGRKWHLGGRELMYMGFRFRTNTVSFCWIGSVSKGVCRFEPFQIEIDEAIDCITGNLDPLLKYTPTPLTESKL